MATTARDIEKYTAKRRLEAAQEHQQVVQLGRLAAGGYVSKEERQQLAKRMQEHSDRLEKALALAKLARLEEFPQTPEEEAEEEARFERWSQETKDWFEGPLGPLRLLSSLGQ